MVNETEKLLSAFSQMYFFKELVQDQLHFIEEGSTEKEVADLLLNLGDIVIAIQLKARNESEKTEDIEKEIRWLNRRCKDAKKQVKDSIACIRTSKLPAFYNKRDQQVSVNPDADIIPLIVFINDNIGDNYEHVLKKHSDDGMDINCLSYQDFQTICKELITPIEIVEYLKWRLPIYLNSNYASVSKNNRDEVSFTVNRNSIEETLVSQFFERWNGKKDAVEMKIQTLHFQWMLNHLPNHVVDESINNSSYSIILLLAHLNRYAILMFEKRIERALILSKEGKYGYVGSIRIKLKRCSIFFVSVPSISKDLIESIAYQGEDFDIVLFVLLYWDNEKKPHIDFLFQDTTGQYIS